MRRENPRRGARLRRDLVDALETGSVFSYFGPRTVRFWKRDVALGRVIGLDLEQGVVHVLTYAFGRPGDGEGPVAEIGHLPILYGALARSIHRIHGKMAGLDPSETLPRWRERYRDDEVGAFSVPLWEAEELAWGTVADADPGVGPDTHFLLYAFPKRDAEGEYTVVEVLCRELDS